ncbi:MAG: MFS transporter, partial [Anaerolineae bacterium]
MTNHQNHDAEQASSGQLSRLTKIVYGTGDWGMATFNTLRQIFYAIFLTDVVGLEPRLASFAVLLGVIWDAINDPLVGVLSDKVQTRWGRRRPFLLFFSIPYGLAFLLLWWAPPIENQLALMGVISLAYMISDTLQTLVIVPFHALTPEMTTDYDERTALSGYRMFFNLLASISMAVAAPMIIDAVMASGGTQQQGYLLAAGIFGASAVIPYLAIFFFVRERYGEERIPEIITFRETVRTAWENIPFRFATLLYMLNWVTFDIIGVVLPFLLVYWVAEGDLVATVPALGMPIESVVLGLMLITAVIVLPFWTWLAQKLSKRIAYVVGMVVGILVLLVLPWVQPHQYTLVMVLASLIGTSVSVAH